MIPVRDTAPCYQTPWVTWCLIIVCSCIFITMKLMPYALSSQLIIQYGMVPMRYANPIWADHAGLPFDYYLSFITSLFLHADGFHLLINMWFLWIFADNIEDRMGHLSFFMFYLICGLCAGLLQWYFDPILEIPVVGASGAIAGVLAAYFFIYPLECVVLWLPPFFLIETPAILFLGIWVIVQLHDATTAVIEHATADVAWWAHLGGFIVGGLVYRLFLEQRVIEITPPTE